MINLKAYTCEFQDLDKFYPIYKEWCEKKGFPFLIKENIESPVFVCYRDRTPIYSCFIWNTNSKMVMIGFPLVNPYITTSFKKGGLSFLFERLTAVLRKRGYTKIWTTSGTPRIMGVLEKEGFVVADEKVNVYIKTI